MLVLAFAVAVFLPAIRISWGAMQFCEVSKISHQSYLDNGRATAPISLGDNHDIKEYQFKLLKIKIQSHKITLLPN
ncbi:MAG: hypothetical protein HC908_04575 [Calothrix sp. SM1_7_51]|nr:hypothetical protein [Calothrix sp. SM1_7_51]